MLTASAGDGSPRPTPTPPNFPDPNAREDGVRRPAWPLTTYGELAAMPVQGGVVCVGLGPERRGGGRLWEFAVPEWETEPEEFEARSVGGPNGLYFCPRGNRIMLLDWLGGGLRWQRDLPGRTVQRLHLAGGVLLVITDEQQVLALDPDSGRERRALPPISGSTRDVQVIGDAVLLLGESAIVGLSARDLENRWSEPCGGVAGFAPVVGREWFAYRDSASEKWRLRNAADGRPALPADIEEAGEFTALYVSGDVLLTAAQRSGGGSEGGPDAAVIAAYDTTTGAALWSRVVETSVPLNITQLAGHPRYVPVLLAARQEERGGEDVQRPSIQLIDKKDGVPGEAVSTGPVSRKTSTCCVSLHVTPSRMIVQAYGNLLGFGNAATGEPR
jgi:hypothetical protein